MLRFSFMAIAFLLFGAGLPAEGRGWLRGGQVIDSASDVAVFNVEEVQPRVGQEFDVYRIELMPATPMRGMRSWFRRVGRVRVAEIVSGHMAKATVLWGLSAASYMIETR